VIAFKMYSFPTIQFQMLYMLNLFATIYIGLVQPKKFWLMNYIELFNEGIFQLGTIHIILFTDYIASQELQYTCGFFMASVIAFLILFNILFVLWFGANDIFLLGKKYFRIVKRYFDPEYMKKSRELIELEDLSGNLPEVYKPFNALQIDVDEFQSLELEDIEEEKSEDV